MLPTSPAKVKCSSAQSPDAHTHTQSRGHLLALSCRLRFMTKLIQLHCLGWLSCSFTLLESTKLPGSWHKSPQDSPIPSICFFPKQDECGTVYHLTCSPTRDIKCVLIFLNEKVIAFQNVQSSYFTCRLIDGCGNVAPAS